MLQHKEYTSAKDTENEITDIDQPKSIKILNTNIEFKNITFKYEDIKVLTDVNFNIKKGKMDSCR